MTQPPSWAATIAVLAALGGAVACGVTLVRQMQSASRNGSSDAGGSGLGFLEPE